MVAKFKVKKYEKAKNTLVVRIKIFITPYVNTNPFTRIYKRKKEKKIYNSRKQTNIYTY